MKEYKQTLSCILLNLSAILSPQLHSFFHRWVPTPSITDSLPNTLTSLYREWNENTVYWMLPLCSCHFERMHFKLQTASFFKHQQEDFKYSLRLLNNSSHIFSLYMSVVLWIVQMIEYSIIFMDIGYLNEVCFNILFFVFIFFRSRL